MALSFLLSWDNHTAVRSRSAFATLLSLLCLSLCSGWGYLWVWLYVLAYGPGEKLGANCNCCCIVIFAGESGACRVRTR